MPATESTRLNRPWLLKMLIFFAVLLFFGLYGLYDAAVAYPARGLRHASYLEYQYLDTASSSGMLEHASVPDPKAELARLETLDRMRASPIDGPRLDWLHSLQVAGALNPARTTIPDPAARYQALKKEWISSSGAVAAPKPLSAYDIPVQWLFVAVGLGGALWMLLLFFNVARRRYSWDPATQTLSLPGGHTLTPADIEDFDKRKWDKFLIFLEIKPTHPTLAGQELKLDLYRYAPLESWILGMERTAFPERTDDSAAPAEPQSVATESHTE
jgi:hypothetical protein